MMPMDSDDVRSRAADDPIRGDGWGVSLWGEETYQVGNTTDP